MDVLDKHGVLDRVHGRILDLGCGPGKARPEYVGVDRLDYPEVDVVGDVFEVLRSVPDGALAGVYSAHFFEHLDDVPALLEELTRTLRVGAQLEVVVPHFSNPYFYSDLSHRSTFGLYSFSYLATDLRYRRQVPSYSRTEAFNLREVTLRFKSPRPFYGRYASKRLIQVLVNANTWTQEFYEENLCYAAPCYEIRFVLDRLDA